MVRMITSAVDRRAWTVVLGLLVLTAGCLGGEPAEVATYDIESPTAAPSPTPRPASVTLTVRDPATGDSTLVRHPNGDTLLVDAGGERDASAVSAGLASAGVSSLGLLLTTGVDADDIGGAAAVLDRHRPDSIGHSGMVANSTDYTRYLRAVVRADRGGRFYSMSNRTVFPYAGGEVSVLAPPDPPLNDGAPRDNVAVISYRYNRERVLFLGDASRREQRWLRNQSGSNLNASVVIVDDGSVASATTLRRIEPEWIVVAGDGPGASRVPDGPWSVRTIDETGPLQLRIHPEGGIELRRGLPAADHSPTPTQTET